MQRYRLSHWKIRWSLITGFIRTTEVIAYDYEDSKTEFEKQTGASKAQIVSSIKA